MNTQTTRTIDIEIRVVEVRDAVIGQVTGPDESCGCRKDSIDVQVGDAGVELDILDATTSVYQASVVIGDVLKGDPGYTPQRGIDYWTPADITEIHNYTQMQIDRDALYWEPL